jgi:hypothetical protein
MDVDAGAAKQDGKQHREMVDGYAAYLSKFRREKSPREAHLFALAMAHKGVTYERSVSSIVLALEGELPAYWPKE